MGLFTFLISLMVLLVSSILSEGHKLDGDQDKSFGRNSLVIGLMQEERILEWLIELTFEIAVEKVNAQLLPEYKIYYTVVDPDCIPKLGMKLAVELRQKPSRVDAIIGSICSVVCEPVALLAAAWNIPQVSFYCSSSVLSNKKVFPTFTRVVGTADGYAKSLVALLQRFEWTRISIVTDTSNIYKQAGLNIKREFESNGVNVFFYTVQPASVGIYKVDEDKLDIIKNVLKEIKRNTRITLILTYGRHIRVFLVLAEMAGMKNGEHSFLALDTALGGSSGGGRGIAPELNDAYVFQGVVTFSYEDPSGAPWTEFFEELTDLNSKKTVPVSEAKIKSFKGLSGK